MRLTSPRIIWALALSSALLCPAKIEEWKDLQGNAFKAEPVEALGPFALFRTQAGGGRRLPWRVLSPEDCVRFHEQAGTKPEAAARWSDAHGDMTGRLRGHLRQFTSANLVTADLDNRPEPQILIMFFVDAAQGSSWDMLTKATAPYNALVHKHPGQAAGVQYGKHQGGPELYNGLASRANLPWLLISYEEQSRINPLVRLAPGRGDCSLYALSRDGVPILALENPDEAAINQFFADVDALLGLMRPTNPKGWADRAHYLSALHAKRHLQDKAGPLLVGDPLVPRRLKEAGIFRVEARIEVGADGKVTSVTVTEDGSIPAKVIPDLAKPLQRSAVFVPAVDHGQFVSGTYDYLLEVPR
jgi:hypothetical protein